MRVAAALLGAAVACSLLVGTLATGENKTEKIKGGKRGRALSVFQIITFQNDPCEGGSKNGTCYTEQECSALDGTNAGSCADGFGVCCIITLNCGEMTNENCTYFDSSGVTPGSCSAEVCPCNDDICQMRLDFTTFTIAGPSTNTDSVTKLKKQAGVVVESADISVTDASMCLTDTFSVSSGGGGFNPPSICGTNTGEHMYIDVTRGSEECASLMFTLGTQGYFASIPTRSWSIKVTQYSCKYSNLAPQGCTQYFFDSTSGNVQTFNYNNGNGRQLGQQDQSICVRRERGNCRICWYAVQPTDFTTAGTSGMTEQVFNKGKLCGSYFSSSSKGFDFVHIPGAEKATGTGKHVGSNICGQNLGLITASKATSVTTLTKSVCSNQQPFVINFRSDAYEMPLEAKANNRGFTLGYTQDSINCP